MEKNLEGLYSGFSKLDRQSRYDRLLKKDILSEEDIEFLKSDKSLPMDLAENLIENVVGYYSMPMGLGMNFKINKKDYVIPMAIEETSIIAAASKTAKWIRESGEILTQSLGKQIIGQIQIAKVKNRERLEKILTEKKSALLEIANGVASGLVRRGGGVQDFTLRFLNHPENGQMAIIHVLADPCDAMGANIINQVCEVLKKPIELWTDETVNMCILSNLVDTKLTKVSIKIEGVSAELGEGIQEASYFAETDPYRAATNNKGILNGMDAVLIATGNDFRAVESGCHAFASLKEHYTSLSKWRYKGGLLSGELIAPIIVGIVGGVTSVHPMAKLALRILKAESAENLSHIVGAVGLVQNLGALKALSTVGVVQGHMKLHAANLALAAGACGDEIPAVRNELQNILQDKKKISLNQAVEVLKRIRSKSGIWNDQPTLSQ